jgi:exonuclease SbcC
MKLLSLRAENFRSFARLELDLNVDGLVAVVGPNGAGKTTVFSAIEWALYGQRGRGSLPVRRDTAPAAENCWVEVEFEVGGRSYRVRRVDGKDAKLTDIATGEKRASGRGDTGRQVGVLLGLNRDMFRGTFYARQKEIQALDSDNDAKRREQVELLLGIERLRRAAGHASTAAKELDRVVEALQSSVPDIAALSAELEQVERDAQAGAPEVKSAEQAVIAAKQARDAQAEALKQVQALEREHQTRAGAHREAKLRADAEVGTRDGLREQVQAAETAAIELETLTPAASLVEHFAEQERKSDQLRDNHERTERLRERQRGALETAAQHADLVSELEAALTRMFATDDANEPLEPKGSPEEQLADRLDAKQHELDRMHAEHDEISDRRRRADARSGELKAMIDRSERAAALEADLAGMVNAEHDADEALGRWHAAQATCTQLQEAIAHDSAHRQAVLAGEAEAACPTCKRPYVVGELETIAAQFDADLEAARDELARTKQEIVDLQELRDSTQRRAKAQRSIAAERKALGDLSDAPSLSDLQHQLIGLDAASSEIDSELTRLEQRQLKLQQELPALRERLRAVSVAQRKVVDVRASLIHAEHEAELFAEELATVPSNGYDPQAHAELRRQLVEARAAGQRCAALRAKADGLELLRRRLGAQDHRAAEALADLDRLAAALAEIPVDENGVQIAQTACDQANQNLDAAHEQLMIASRQASADSEAVAAARTRLQGARRQSALLAEQRAELRMRQEVADALTAYRESVSRRARPQLEQETALLLSHTTRGRYSTVRLSDAYQLEIADGRQLYPLRRFSGGEQDLAALCLRLALSRMLARQRGAETGFVLLDEVFGSQDVDRRRALLEQLRVLGDREFRQVFVISHTEDVVEWCDLSVTVQRDADGVSTATGPHR